MFLTKIAQVTFPGRLKLPGALTWYKVYHVMHRGKRVHTYTGTRAHIHIQGASKRTQREQASAHIHIQGASKRTHTFEFCSGLWREYKLTGTIIRPEGDKKSKEDNLATCRQLNQCILLDWIGLSLCLPTGLCLRARVYVSARVYGLQSEHFEKNTT